MSVEGLNAIAFYPELRNCRSPSASRILEIVNGVRVTRSLPAGTGAGWASQTR